IRYRQLLPGIAPLARSPDDVHRHREKLDIGPGKPARHIAADRRGEIGEAEPGRGRLGPARDVERTGRDRAGPGEADRAAADADRGCPEAPGEVERGRPRRNLRSAAAAFDDGPAGARAQRYAAP